MAPGRTEAWYCWGKLRAAEPGVSKPGKQTCDEMRKGAGKGQICRMLKLWEEILFYFQCHVEIQLTVISSWESSKLSLGKDYPS